MKTRILFKIVPLSILLIFALLFAASTVSATNYTFTGGGSDNLWDNAANWDVNGVPGVLTASDAVVINAPCRRHVIANVTIPCPFTIGANGTFQFEQGDDTAIMTFTSTASFTNNGTVTLITKWVNNSANFINNGSILLRAPISAANEGTGVGAIENRGTFNNQSTGTFSVGSSSATTFGRFDNYGPGIFNNYGIVLNNFLWYNNAGSTLNNYGSFTSPNTAGSVLNAGIMNMIGNGAVFSYRCIFDNTGQFNPFTGGNRPENVAGTVNLLTGCNLIIGRNSIFSAGGIVNWNAGATVTINTIDPVSIQSGQQLTVPQGCTLIIGATNILRLNSGATLTNLGAINILASTISNSFLIVDAGANFNNSGTLTIASTASLLLNNNLVSNTGTINIQSGGFLTIGTTGVTIPTGTINWNGTISISRGVTSTLSSNFTVPTTGILNVESSATLVVNANITFTNLNLIQNFGNITNNGNWIFNAITAAMFNSSRITNNGTLSLSNGAIFYNDEYAVFTNASSATVNVDNATFRVETLNNIGTLNLNLNGYLDLRQRSMTSLPTGTFNWSSGGTVALGTATTFNLDNDFTILSGQRLHIFGNFNIAANRTFSNNGYLRTGVNNITNNGTLVSNNTWEQTPSTITNNGTIQINSTFNNYGTLTNNANSTFKGNGTVVRTGLIFNTGSNIAPGSSPGTLTIRSNLDLGGATYLCEINGTTASTTYDVLAITGAATLTNASLNVVWGFTPPTGTTYTILTCGSRTGQFASINIPAVAGRNFTVQYFTTSVVIEVTAVLSAELVHFSAKQNGSTAELTWQTANEVAVKNFDIEKSLDGKTFLKIAEVKANNTPSVYSTVDDQFSASAYYRLKINDLDGTSKFSNIVFLEKSPFGGKGAKIQRNTEGGVWVETDDKIESVIVSNSIGQVLKTTKDNRLSLSDLPKGIYIVTVKTDKAYVSEKVFNF